MENNFQTNISNIRKAIDNNKLVVFAGAGISVDAGVPKWSELINAMKKEINVSKNETDYLKIAQFYYNERQQKEYIDKVRSVLNHKKVQSNEIHEVIFKLNPNGILTTNYDDLLDQVIEKEALPYSIVTRDKDFPYAINNNLLVKVHGDLNNTDIVLKEDDYLNYSSTHPLIESFIKSVFSNKLVMFVGYSYSDYNLKHIIKNVKTILGNNYQYSYLLTTDKNISEAQKNYFKLNGIILVNYSEFENEILAFLNGNNYFNEKLYIKGKRLKKQGQDLLNLLVYINHFNPFIESLKGLNLIEQAYLSLERYSEMKSLPPNFLVNLYPFNVHSRKQYNYYSFSMSISNKRQFERFKKYIVKDNNKYKLNLPKRVTLSNVKKVELNAKLNEVISRLNLSNIFYLSNYKNVNELKEASIFHDNICKCLTCKYSRFEFDEILNEISDNKFDSNLALEESLLVVYMQFKFGDFEKAFELFKELGNKAWGQGKFYLFLIIKINLLRLNRFIFNDFSKSEVEKANLSKYLNYNIDEIYNRIPYLGNDENTLLAQIKDDYVLDNSRYNLLKILDEVYSIKDLYDKNGQRWGDKDSVMESTFYVQNIISFYTNNNIIYDEFSDFTNTINNGLEVYLISSILDETYNNKLDFFTNEFSHWFIYYGNNEKLLNIISRYNIEFLKYKRIEDTGLVLAKRFFENFYVKSRFETENLKIKKNLNIEYFKNKCLKYSKNIFILLSYT
ncbi:MAG: SIR2 family protein, partial [Chitinophagales bacterium]